MFRLTTSLNRLYRQHAALTVVGVGMGLLTLLFVILVFADPRSITGQPAWLKPAKFGVSIALYTLTLAWLLGFVDTARRWKARLVGGLGWVIALALALEMVPIALQVVRGTTSHFNVATAFDAFWWSVMGISISVLWAAHLLVTLLLLFQKLERPAFAWSLRLGLTLTLLGMALGFLMTSPTAQQRAGWARGESVTVIGAHTVGRPDGGPGLPVTGWSTEGGDLRIGHFIGMHALQVLPLLGWLVGRRRFTLWQQLRLVWTVGLGYLGLMLLVTLQALRAQPLLHPDRLTAAAFVALVLSVAAASYLSARARPRRALPLQEVLS